MMRHTVSLKRLLFFILGCAIVLSGCESAGQNGSGAESNQAPYIFEGGLIDTQDVELMSENGQESTPNDYTFSPGDSIDVKFFYTPELNETQDVRPDGKIALQIIGEVTAAGKTPAQLRWLLEKLYASHLKDPEISVVVRSFSNQRVYVGGQVMSPGTIEVSGRMTALEAIMEAGGVDFREAQVRNVVVIRHYNGTRYGYMLNMEPILEGKESHPFFLEAKDIVYVPRTEIAKVNQWIDQYINKIVPQTGFTYFQRRGNSTVGIDTSTR
jgi:polysaccharide export outer membrane protein